MTSPPPSTTEAALPDELMSWLRWLSEHAGATPEQSMSVLGWDELLAHLDTLATGLARTLHPVAGPAGTPIPLPGSAEQLLAVAFWHVAQLRELLTLGRSADQPPERRALLYGLVLGACSLLASVQDHLVARGYR